MNGYPALVDYVEKRVGLTLPVAPTPELEQVVQQRLRHYGHLDVRPYLGTLAQDTEEWEALLATILIHRTWFFRDSTQIDAIRAFLAELPTSAEIWSAGCATGEEVYTLALLLLELGKQGSVLGTDLLNTCLEVGRQGRYAERTMSRVPDDLRERYFERQGADLVASDALRARARFYAHNLCAADQPPEGPSRGFDLIVCRNVLIYFSPERSRRVSEQLLAALNPRGALVLGAAESMTTVDRSWERRIINDRLLFLPRRVAPSVAPPPIRTTRAPPRAAPLAPAKVAPELGPDPLTPLEIAVERHPLDPESRLELGVALFEIGQWIRASQELRSVLFLDEDRWLAVFLLGQIQRSRGQTAKVRASYQRTLELLGRPGADAATHVPKSSSWGAERVTQTCRAWLGGG